MRELSCQFFSRQESRSYLKLFQDSTFESYFSDLTLRKELNSTSFVSGYSIWFFYWPCDKRNNIFQMQLFLSVYAQRQLKIRMCISSKGVENAQTYTYIQINENNCFVYFETCLYKRRGISSQMKWSARMWFHIFGHVFPYI